MKLLCLFALLACNLVAPARQTLKPDDGKSIDTIIAALYDVISGPIGQKRDWERMKALFAPEAKMMAFGKRRDGTQSKAVITVQQYIDQSGPFLESRGFFETEASRKTETFGNIAHVWSSYESCWKPGEKPFAKGINSIQLWNDGKRWWIVSIIWQDA